jgi:hypothetical protein
MLCILQKLNGINHRDRRSRPLILLKILQKHFLIHDRPC